MSESTKSIPEDKEKANKDERSKRTSIFEEEGSSRAIVSGAYFFVFAVIGSITLFIFNVMATGNPGLEYYGESFVLLNMFIAVGSGIYPSYVARVKATFVHDKERALIQASSYSKLILVIGLIFSIAGFIVYLIVPSPFVKASIIAIIPAVMLSYVTGSFSNMITLINRFDIAAFISSLFGIIVFLSGLIFITFSFEPLWFSFIPLFTGVVSAILSLFFFTRVSPFKFKDIYTKGKLFSKENSIFLKEGLYSTLTNLEGLGVLGNAIIFITTLSLFAFYPDLEQKGIHLITIIMTYAIIKVAIIFFTGPLNVEISEATSKNNHEIVQDTMNNLGRICGIIGLTLTVFVCALSPHILRYLHPDAFIDNGVHIEATLIMTTYLLILATIGEACYGFSCLFGGALIGSGNAKYSAVVFGTALILIIPLTPLCVFFFGILGAGWAIFISGFYLLPLMFILVKKRLKVDFDLKVINQAPYLIAIFLLVFLFPLGLITGNALFDLVIVTALSIGILFFGIAFFGVMTPNDAKLIKDLTSSFNAKWVENLVKKFGKFFYYLNPFHKKPKFEENET